jgi:hypothetical protein
MSADLEGGKFVGCGELFVLSGNFKSPRTSGANCSLPPSWRAERAIPKDCPPVTEVASAIKTGETHRPVPPPSEGVVSGASLTVSGAV